MGKKDTTETKSRFAKPSEASGGDSWSLTDGDEAKSGKNDGELMLITPLREAEVEDKYSKTPGATKKVIVADVVHLNRKKPEKSEEHEDVYVWGAWLQGSLRSYIGKEMVLGTVAKTADSKSGTGYVWKLEDADNADIDVAEAYLASLSPFKASGEKRDKAKPAETKVSKDTDSGKKAKKGKKS